MQITPDPQHLSGFGLVTGQAKFIGDEVKPSTMHYVKCLASPYAHAKIISIDASKAEKLPGVIKVLTWKDIPGKNQIGHMLQDQPLLPQNEVVFIGQAVAIIVAKTNKIALYARKLIHVEYEKLPAIFTIEEALAKENLYVPLRTIERGNIEEGFSKADFVLESEVNTGAQDHIYFETNRCWAFPGDDNNITLYSSTQHTSETQRLVAEILGLAIKDVTVDVKRLGGAFGYKEVGGVYWSCLAALAAYVTKKPVELKLDRLEDQTWTGKRHPFRGKYKISFDKIGKILAYDVSLIANGGAFADVSIPIFERAMFHAENAYFIPNIKIVGGACRTNLPPNTAFRGFGAPQGIFVIEHAIEKIAEKLKFDPVEVRAINAYSPGETTPYGAIVDEPCFPEIFMRLKEKCNYQKLREETDAFNQNNKYIKRGIAITPLKFGIAFTFTPLNQATSLIWLYPDGSISMSHGGIEMGQQVNTKVAQVVAREFGMTLDHIRVESSNTQRNGNASPTAASTGSDLNGFAALDAAKQIKSRISEVAANIIAERAKVNVSKTQPQLETLVFVNNTIYDSRFPDIKLTLAEVASQAYLQRINLGAQGFYKTPHIFFDGTKMQGRPFLYYVYGAALVQIEVDILTGMNKLLKVYIMHEAGRPLNRSVDLGQISGAFMQGFGYATMEEIMHDTTGRYITNTLSTYKIPTIHDLPEIFDIELIERDAKNASVMGSKAVGEPPLIYGFAAYFAINDAIKSLNPGKSINLPMPATPEAVALTINKLLEQNND